MAQKSRQRWRGHRNKAGFSGEPLQRQALDSASFMESQRPYSATANGHAPPPPLHASPRQKHPKRKADGSWPQGRRPPPPKTAANRRNRASDNLAEDLDLPTPSDYANTELGASFFAQLRAGASSVYANFLRHRGLRVNQDVQVRNGLFHCVVDASIAQHPFSERFEGRAESKRRATNAAHLKLVSKLHTEGILRQMYVHDDDVVPANTDIFQNEADAKMDMYNYAARFLLVPEIAVREVSNPLRPGRKLHDVRIELPAQGISVVSRAQAVRTAELSACLRFKKAAEEFHAQHGEESIAVRDQSALHTGNAKNFFTFLKGTGRIADYEMDFKEVKTEWGARALLTPTDSLELPPAPKAVSMASKKKAEDLAYLVAAIGIIKDNPALQQEFRKRLSSSGNTLLLRPRPVQLDLERSTLQAMRMTLQGVSNADLLADLEEQSLGRERTEESSHVHAPYRRPSDQTLARRSTDLLRSQNAYKVDPSLEELREKREALPMSKYRDRVLDMIGKNCYSIVIGATGSGKTTQVPQILLDDAIARGDGARCNVVCTQPRRIAATSVAQRVAAERAERLRSSVGYHVRFDAKRPRYDGSITYCTTGILLQQMQHSPDDVCDRSSHIIIDEVHERDINIDFLMVILKRAIKTRLAAGKPVPRVTLMSATLDPELFANYFKNEAPDGSLVPCPSLSVPGRTFPVTHKYLDTVLAEIREDPNGGWLEKSFRLDRESREFIKIEQRVEAVRNDGGEEDAEPTIEWKQERKIDADGEVSTESEDAMVPVSLVAASIANICKRSDDGAVLVFLPGYEEIKSVRETLETQAPLGVNFRDTSMFRVMALHSSVPQAEQAAAFEAVPPGCRKIILSTNIAETSVTIPDVKYVVDTGKLREKRYDQVRRIAKLQCTWISKSNAKQRSGRAGRVQDGHYYALYSRPRFDSLRAVGLPEMLRSDLEEVCLSIKSQAFKMPIRDFLAHAVEPPSSAAVNAAIEGLEQLGALTADEALTPLGRVLARLPIHPSLGKMIVLGAIFRCLDPVVVLGAAAAERALLVRPPERRQEAAEAAARFSQNNRSDHLTLLAAFNKVRRARNQGVQQMMEFASANFVHYGAFNSISNTAKQIEGILIEEGIIPQMQYRDRFEGEIGHPSVNVNANKPSLIKALAVAGMQPNLGVAFGPKLFRTASESNVMVYPASVNYGRGGRADSEMRVGDLLTYSALVRSNDQRTLFMRDSSVVSPLTAFLFGGPLTANNGKVLDINYWLPFYVNAHYSDMRLLVDFRSTLDTVLDRSFRGLAAARGGGAGLAFAEDEGFKAFTQGVAALLDSEEVILDYPAARRHVPAIDLDDINFAGPGGGFGGGSGPRSAAASWR